MPNSFEEDLDEDLVLLHKIYPDLSWQELLQAKENLDRYIDLAIRIFLRLEREEAEKAMCSNKNSTDQLNKH